MVNEVNCLLTIRKIYSLPHCYFVTSRVQKITRLVNLYKSYLYILSHLWKTRLQKLFMILFHQTIFFLNYYYYCVTIPNLGDNRIDYILLSEERAGLRLTAVHQYKGAYVCFQVGVVGFWKNRDFYVYKYGRKLKEWKGEENGGTRGKYVSVCLVWSRPHVHANISLVFWRIPIWRPMWSIRKNGYKLFIPSSLTLI